MPRGQYDRSKIKHKNTTQAQPTSKPATWNEQELTLAPGQCIIAISTTDNSVIGKFNSAEELSQELENRNLSTRDVEFGLYTPARFKMKMVGVTVTSRGMDAATAVTNALIPEPTVKRGPGRPRKHQVSANGTHAQA